ncbi:hypothetical protein ASPZODRAFT_13393 [Penicilliopsis zonata CBS 506.65]|uniref:Uncharacterized protein n=1 Tax=Penicilliopsis zonata CBS 506.65 TaxID=1073090 RepID=A0A1L9STA7_9EURO|nr:hypothetical protein ASPZODRAFT_13393 [Penicilliopsis zonata CBS 506.65]OJJ50307.1 hypothetical protein ASPZODRAFT_13393 [Penicilliopsis zonata CBS 506.65]
MYTTTFNPEETLEDARGNLEAHLYNLDGLSDRPRVKFFIEVCPDKLRPDVCRHPKCQQDIDALEYRVAVQPSISSPWRNRATEFYHLNCFEEVADFNNPNHVQRVYPLTRHNYEECRLRRRQFSRGHYLVNSGAERLIEKWKENRLALIQDVHEDFHANIDAALQTFTAATQAGSTATNQTDNTEAETIIPNNQFATTMAAAAAYAASLSAASANARVADTEVETETENGTAVSQPVVSELEELRNRAGSASYVLPNHIPGVDDFEVFLLGRVLAPIQSSGPGDTNEWNLFDAYLAPYGDGLGLNELSEALDSYQYDQKIALKKDDQLSHEERRYKDEQLGKNAVDALCRLAPIPFEHTWICPCTYGIEDPE